MLYYKVENDAHITHTQRCTLQIYLASKNFICNFPFYLYTTSTTDKCSFLQFDFLCKDVKI